MLQSGVLLIDKPEGPSSARVVQRVKRRMGAAKVGHLGTLDPFASGLLPLAINQGTKIAQIFLDAPKSYAGVMRMGIVTDTQDRTGKVLEVREVPKLSEEEIRRLRRSFTGTLMQTPPMFSALKKEGVRLYRLARQGKNVPRPQREVRVEKLRLRKMGLDEIAFEVTCSKGTYIRTLAADMGEFLGCGAHLKSLRRLSCGPLTLKQAITLEELESVEKGKEFPVLSLNQALGHLRSVRLENQWLSQLRLGRQEVLARLGPPMEEEALLRLVDPRGSLIALVQWEPKEGGGQWRLFRVFKG